MSVTELQTLAAKAVLTSANVKPEAVDSVIVGIVGAVSILFIYIFYDNIRLHDLKD